MTRPRKPDTPQIGEIDPGTFYRTTLAPAIFGVGWQSARNKVLAGELPVPYGEPQGWDGSQIIAHREKMKAAAEAKAAKDAARPRQQQPEAFKGKTKKKVAKVKLRART